MREARSAARNRVKARNHWRHRFQDLLGRKAAATMTFEQAGATKTHTQKKLVKIHSKSSRKFVHLRTRTRACCVCDVQLRVLLRCRRSAPSDAALLSSGRQIFASIRATRLATESKLQCLFIERSYSHSKTNTKHTFYKFFFVDNFARHTTINH